MYEPHILELLELPGYIKYYLSVLPEYSEFKHPGKEAYKATERMFELHFGKSKFANYNSFKAALSRYYKQKKKK